MNSDISNSSSSENYTDPYNGREHEELPTYFGNDIAIPHNNTEIIMNKNLSQVILANETLKRIINPFGVEFDFLGELRQQVAEVQVLYITVPVTTVTSTTGRDPNRPAYLDRTLAPTDYTIVANSTLVYTSTVGIKTETTTISPTTTVVVTMVDGRVREIATKPPSSSLQTMTADPRRRRRSVPDSDVEKQQEDDQVITADDVQRPGELPRPLHSTSGEKDGEEKIVNEENVVKNIELQAHFLGRTLFDPSSLTPSPLNTTTDEPVEENDNNATTSLTTKTSEHYLAAGSHHSAEATAVQTPVEIETGIGVMKVSTTTSSPPLYVLGNKSSTPNKMNLAGNGSSVDTDEHQPFALRSIGGDEAVISPPPHAETSSASSFPSLSATNFADDRNALLDYLEGRQFAAAINGGTFAATSPPPHTSRLVTASPAQLLRLQQQQNRNRNQQSDVNNEPRIITADDVRRLRTSSANNTSEAGLAQTTGPNVTAITQCTEWYIGPNCSINVLILMLAIWLVVLVFGVAVVCCCLYHTPQVVRSTATSENDAAIRRAQQNELCAAGTAPAGAAWLFTRGGSAKDRDGATFYRQFNDHATIQQQQHLEKSAPPFTIKLPTPDYDEDDDDEEGDIDSDFDRTKKQQKVNNYSNGQWPPHHTPFAPPPQAANNTVDYLYYHPTVSTAPNLQQPAVSAASSAYSAAAIARNQQAMSRHSFLYNPSDCCQSPTHSVSGHSAPPPKPPRRPSQNYTHDGGQQTEVDLDPYAHQNQQPTQPPPLKPKRQLGQSPCYTTGSMTLPAEQQQNRNHYTTTTTSTTADEITTNDDSEVEESEMRNRSQQQRKNSKKRVTGSVDELLNQRSESWSRRKAATKYLNTTTITTKTKTDTPKRRASSNKAARSNTEVSREWTNGHSQQQIAESLPNVAVKRHHSFACGMPLFLPPGARSTADIPANILTASNASMRLSQTTLTDATTNTVLDDSNVQQIARSRRQQQQNGGSSSVLMSTSSSPHPQQHMLMNGNNVLLRSATTLNGANSVHRRPQQQQQQQPILYATSAAAGIDREPTYIAVDANGTPVHVMRRGSFAVAGPEGAFIYGMYPAGAPAAPAVYGHPSPMLAIPHRAMQMGVNGGTFYKTATGMVAIAPMVGSGSGPPLYTTTGGPQQQEWQRSTIVQRSSSLLQPYVLVSGGQQAGDDRHCSKA